MESKLQPTLDRVLVKRKQRDEKTPGGLYVPANAEDKAPFVATVIAIGPGRYFQNGERDPVAIIPDEEVLVAKYAGIEVEFNGEALLVVREEDILAVVSRR